MRENDPSVESLMNIGPTIARRLREVRIHTRSDLKSVGPVAAFHRIRKRWAGKTIPVCYYLYSLQGALCDVHWDALSESDKRALRRQAGID
jgi:TfoX C-terminal domain